MKIIKNFIYYGLAGYALIIVMIRIIAEAVALGMDGRLKKIGTRRKP